MDKELEKLRAQSRALKDQQLAAREAKRAASEAYGSAINALVAAQKDGNQEAVKDCTNAVNETADAFRKEIGRASCRERV